MRAAALRILELREYLQSEERGIDGDVSGKLLEFLFDDEPVSVDFELLIFFFRLILSQPQLRAPSAECHVDPQNEVRPVLETLVELLLSGLGNSDHELFLLSRSLPF